MVATILPVMPALWIAQSQGEPAANAVAVGIGLVAILAAMVLIWAIFRGRNLVAQLGALNKKLEELTEAKRELGGKERKQAKDLEGKRNEIKKLKKDIAGQRKKNHSATEENKKLRADLSGQREVFDKRSNTRPAFADDNPADKSDKKQQASAQEKAADKSADAGKAVSGTTLKELEEKSEQLRAANEKLTQELTQVREQWDNERGDLKKIKKRIEDYRRIDVISAGKVTALEDRINHLGRQYYEACTEIAVLKGEVPRLPPPEEYPPERELKAAAAPQPKPKDVDESVATAAAPAEAPAQEDPTAAPDDDTESSTRIAADREGQEIRSSATEGAPDPSADESGATAV